MIALIASLALQAAAVPPPGLVAALRAKDQALLDAIAPGNRAAWDAALAPDAVYVDENGTILTRAAFLEALVPLAKGVSGHLTIVDYRVRLLGNTALVIHRDDEREDYHGQALRAGYLMTETWVKRGGGWKLAMTHAYVEARDPPAAPAPLAGLDAYVGRYRAAPDLVYLIRKETDHLVGGREGASARPLLVESGDVMFIAGEPRSRKIFQRGPDGRVTGFLDRREGEDLHWRRLP